MTLVLRPHLPSALGDRNKDVTLYDFVRGHTGG